MLVIRLQRTGRRNIPAYRISVAEKSHAVKGKVKEYLGHYLPARNPHIFEYNEERIQYWVGKGAIPSNTIARLLKRSGVNAMEKYIEPYTKRKARNPEEEAKVVPEAKKEEGK